MKKQKSVIISLWSAGSCGRRQLSGILRFIDAGHDWSTRIIMDPKDLTPTLIAEAARNGTDGFIAFVPPESEKELARAKIPAVVLSYPGATLRRRKRNIVFFINDNAAIGRKGADYLFSLGRFASYAFLPDSAGRGWSRERETAFCRRLAEHGEEVRVFDAAREALGDWLRALPKPAAVMTPFDLKAQEIVDVCKRLNIAVPKEVSILGVDDDELICEAARPTISSIAIDQEAIGYRAAESLNRLMCARKSLPAETALMPCGRISERGSTRPVAPTVHVVKRIQSVIDEHFREGITVNDIASRLGISRRLADLRYSEATGRTIRAALEERRLTEIKLKLETSDLPIARITRLCGVENELWIKYVFKRRTGLTMTQWRETHARKAAR